VDYKALGLAILAGIVAVSLAALFQSWHPRRVRTRLRRGHRRTHRALQTVSPPEIVASESPAREDFEFVSSQEPIQQSTIALPAPHGQPVSSRTPLARYSSGGRVFPIETLEEFHSFHKNTVGAIVITDGRSRAKAHRPDCPTLTDANFTKKVITNQSKSGKYFYFTRLEDAARQLNARRCHICLQLTP
jgi:hypothetical protein